jgi:hypothetical protein
MTWSEYDGVTETISDLIEGTNRDTSGAESFLYPGDDSLFSSEYCCDETYTLLKFLRYAYTSTLNNKNTAARFYLWFAKIYLKSNQYILRNNPY